VRRIVDVHRSAGTTGCLPTLITDNTEVIEPIGCRCPGDLKKFPACSVFISKGRH
jgi:N-acetylglucosamine-6-phosphate deacetylase